MNTAALREPETFIVSSIYTALEAGKRQIRKLAWMFERHHDTNGNNTFDYHLGLVSQALNVAARR